MTMITITDDNKHTILFDPTSYVFEQVIFENRWEIDCESNDSPAFRLYFNTEERMQKVWDRLCEITGARDIFDDVFYNYNGCNFEVLVRGSKPDIDEDMSLPPIPPCHVCGKDAAEIFELDKNAIMRNYCRDCAKISKNREEISRPVPREKRPEPPPDGDEDGIQNKGF